MQPILFYTSCQLSPATCLFLVEIKSLFLVYSMCSEALVRQFFQGQLSIMVSLGDIGEEILIGHK